ncbi:MAG: hypothetical protein KIS92_01850 [Planctomycetota bacterium]|nr:hypothetical protein [Planctomycetota bacterium]
MAFQKTQGMNKEKLVFYLCLVLLMVSGYLFLFGPRTKPLQDDDPITHKGKPEAFDVKAPSIRVAKALAADRERKSPFTPDLNWRTTVVNKPNPAPSKNVPPPPPPPPAQPKTTPKTPSAMTPTEKDLEVGFMGIVQLNGKSYALLSSKDGSPPRRVKEGDVLDGLNYTITKIDKQAIYISDAEGRPYILKDGRFEDIGGGSTGGSGPSFTQPKKQPQQPQQPKTQTPQTPQTPRNNGPRPGGGGRTRGG